MFAAQCGDITYSIFLISFNVACKFSIFYLDMFLLQKTNTFQTTGGSIAEFGPNKINDALIIEKNGSGVRYLKEEYWDDIWITAICSFVAEPVRKYIWKFKISKGNSICVGVSQNIYTDTHNEGCWYERLYQ